MVNDRRERDSDQVFSELSEDLGHLVDELYEDVGKLSRLLRRAFPGTQPDEAEIRARRDKLRRADVEPSDAEREAARLQEEARGKHTIYAVTARHHRRKPFESDWVGHTQSVRVTLPRTRAEAQPIWTYLGVVKAEDHLLFSIEEIVEGYAARFGARPQIQRLDLVTGARHYDLDRFSPISVFLAYEQVDDKQASFYVYESGSAQGNPAALYYAPTMGATLLEHAGFQFTPFACKTNWYTGKLIMNRARTEPSVVSISIAQQRDGERHYLELTASFEVVEPGKVVWPVALQIQAALRVFAIAQGMGCKLELWEWGLGQLGRSAFDWIAEPPDRGTSEGYSGCTRDAPS
ncbi:MAG TPA: hypothetical protein VK034_06640 [Enhygromyxa sp.]|nr:hypothetical protein [Enhygromyxa sp.]